MNIVIEELHDFKKNNENKDKNNEEDKNNEDEDKNNEENFESFDDFFLQDCPNAKSDLLYVKKMDYMENYKVDDLKKIAKFYEIPVQRKKKEDLVEEIIIYEDCLENLEKVQRRFLYWGYLEELKTDPYFKQFVVF